MIKTILVPATGSDLDIAVFRSALTWRAHLQRISKSCMSTSMPRQWLRRWFQMQELELAPRSSEWSIR